MNYRKVGLSSGRRFTGSDVFLQNTAGALLFTLSSAQFLVHFLSNGGDRGLRARVIMLLAAVQLRCLLVCLLVTSWPPLCDESTAWRVDRVTRWPCDELTGSQILQVSLLSLLHVQDITMMFHKDFCIAWFHLGRFHHAGTVFLLDNIRRTTTTTAILRCK